VIFRAVQKSGPICFFILSQITRLTDRQTDRQNSHR